MVNNIWNDKEATEKIIAQVRDARVVQLEDALDIAVTYIEELVGSDADESETLQYLTRILNGGDDDTCA